MMEVDNSYNNRSDYYYNNNNYYHYYYYSDEETDEEHGTCLASYLALWHNCDYNFDDDNNSY